MTPEQTFVKGPPAAAPRAKVVVLFPFASPVNGALTVTCVQEFGAAVGAPVVTFGSEAARVAQLVESDVE